MIAHPPLAAPAEPRRVAFEAGRQAQTAALIVAWLLLTCAAGFRWLGDSRDYLQYLAYYDQIPPYLSFNYTRFEPGFHVCAWFARTYLNLEYDYFVLIVAGVSLAIKFHLFRKYLRYPLLAVITYAAIFYPVHEYTQIRIGIALAFGYLTIHNLYEKRYLWGAIWFVPAYLFHTSAIVLPLAFLASRYVRGNMSVILIGVGAAVLFYPVRATCASSSCRCSRQSTPAQGLCRQYHLQIGQPVVDQQSAADRRAGGRGGDRLVQVQPLPRHLPDFVDRLGRRGGGAGLLADHRDPDQGRAVRRDDLPDLPVADLASDAADDPVDVGECEPALLSGLARRPHHVLTGR